MSAGRIKTLVRGNGYSKLTQSINECLNWTLHGISLLANFQSGSNEEFSTETCFIQPFLVIGPIKQVKHKKPGKWKLCFVDHG